MEYCLIIISWSYEFPLGIIAILLRYVFCSWRNHMLLYPSSSSVQFSKTNYLPHLIHFSLHIYIHTNVDTYMFCIWKLLNIIPKQHIRNHSKTSYVLYLFDEWENTFWKWQKMRHILATEKLAALLKYFFDETECFTFIVKPNITPVKIYSTKHLWPVRRGWWINTIIDNITLTKLANLLFVII